MSWYVYVARCRDGTLYCGIARDVAARIAAHDAGTGARYTRGRGPLQVVLLRRCRDQGRALRLEHAIKQLSRAQKEALVAAPAGIARLVRALRPVRGSARTPRGARAGRRSRSRRPRAEARPTHEICNTAAP